MISRDNLQFLSKRLKEVPSETYRKFQMSDKAISDTQLLPSQKWNNITTHSFQLAVQWYHDNVSYPYIMGSSACSSRSVYLSKLRRAFLLRVHPDRFRTKHPKVVRNQATLVQALSSRMGQTDFVRWQQQKQHIDDIGHFISFEESKIHKFVVELRDGTLQKHNIELGGTVESILESMQNTLVHTGEKAIPKPRSVGDGLPSNLVGGLRQNLKMGGLSTEGHIVQSRGRDLVEFVQRLDQGEIEARKQARIDAQAAALAVRQAYQFQSVDATSLGWSSASVAVLLRRLLDLKVEHDINFRFYPLRLVFSSQYGIPALDAYGGVVRLTAASTPLQWRQSLRRVDANSLTKFAHYQRMLLERSKALGSFLGVRVRKGYSCSNEDYHAFIKQLIPPNEETSLTDSFFPTLINSEIGKLGLVLVVESSQAVRRPRVTPQGNISVGNQKCTVDSLSRVILELSETAAKQCEDHRKQRQVCHGYMDLLQQLGLAKLTADPVVPLPDLAFALERLLQTDTAHLVGHQIRFVARGRHCHLTDDGSLGVPIDWQ